MLQRAALALLAVGLAHPALAQTDPATAKPPLKIGFVLPAKTGERPVKISSVNDFIGEAALLGARVAEGSVGADAEKRGLAIKFLYASSPSVEAGERAARRLVAVDHVSALVGGVGDGQAEMLNRISAELKVPFLNIGSSSDALRNAECNRFAFHVAASDAMYVDAIAAIAADEGGLKWFVVHDETPAGAALMDAVKAAAAEVGAAVAGSAAVAKAKPSYFGTLRDAEDAGADVIILLLDAQDQMVFIEQQDSSGSKLPTMPLPAPLSQTRDYLAAARYNAPRAHPRHRVALWETTVAEGGASTFNEAYTSRFGEPADPTAWSAWAAAKVLAEAALVAGAEPAALQTYLEQPDATFDLLKGTALSFRAWDHQLRQPLFEIAIVEGEWSPNLLSSKVAVARLAGQLPERVESDTIIALDAYGTPQQQTGCRF